MFGVEDAVNFGINKIEPSIAGKVSNWYDNVTNEILLRTPTNKKPMDDSGHGRVIASAQHGIAGGVTAGVLSALFPKHVTKSDVVTNMLVGATVGYLVPKLHNTLYDYKKGLKSRENVINVSKIMSARSKKIGDTVRDLGSYISSYGKGDNPSGGLDKKAGVLHSVGGRLAKGTLSAVGTTSDALIKGLGRTPKGATLSRKAFGLGVKGGAVYTGLKGAGAVRRAFNAPRSSSNYTTMLRNNILSGNITQNQLTQPDLVSVRKLGLR